MQSNRQKKPSFREALKTAFHLPVRNDEFSPKKALALGFLAASFYGFVSYWLTLFIDGSKNDALAIGIILFISGFLLSLIFDRWRMGFALDELIEPTIQLALFIIAWAVIS